MVRDTRQLQAPSACRASCAQVQWSGHAGTVRFVGNTHFAAGEWVGVELDEAAGRHDGTFMGVTYFECGAEHGVFSQASLPLADAGCVPRLGAVQKPPVGPSTTSQGVALAISRRESCGPGRLVTD